MFLEATTAFSKVFEVGVAVMSRGAQEGGVPLLKFLFI